MIVAGRYELGEKLGAGGEARVFRAHDRGTNTDVALRLTGKTSSLIVPTTPAPSPLHPGWVRLLDRGLDPVHGSYAAFELLRGETLAAQVTRLPLDALRLLEFVNQSLDAVGALHAAGWIHGDLNAENFFLHNQANWKLLELPFHHPPPASRPALFGSIYTLAPEQFEGRPPDARSDLFALGCLYYYAAAGRYPHAGGTDAEIAIGRLRFPPEPLAQLAPSLPAKLQAAITRLLARDPAQRPASAKEARELFDRAL